MKLPDRIVDPGERIAEILFGLIMALTISGTLSVATADHLQIRTMLIGVLGCNLAWGIIDGGMYLMARLAEKGRNILLIRDVRTASSHDNAHRAIAESLPEPFASAFQAAQLEAVREGISRLSQVDERPRLAARDWLGALGVCILVVVSTFPVVIPFLVIGTASLALRVSNAIALVMLFLCGFLFARYAGLNPWVMGFIMVCVGAAEVSIAIALGG
jgi:VIT family protein